MSYCPYKTEQFDQTKHNKNPVLSDEKSFFLSVCDAVYYKGDGIARQTRNQQNLMISILKKAKSKTNKPYDCNQ